MRLLDTPGPSQISFLAAVVALAGMVSCRGREEGLAASLDRDDVVPAATIGSTTIFVHRNLEAVASLKPQLLELVRLGLDSIGRCVPVRDLETEAPRRAARGALVVSRRPASGCVQRARERTARRLRRSRRRPAGPPGPRRPAAT